MKKRLVASLSLCCACVFVAGAAAALEPGVYRARISGASPAVLNGTWRITLGAPTTGYFRITRNNSIAVEGTIKIRGNRITFSDFFGPFRCKGTQYRGTYRWTLNGKALTLRVVSDACTGRRAVLSRPFRKLS